MRYEWEGRSLVPLRMKRALIAEINAQIFRLATERSRIEGEFLTELAELIGRPGARLLDGHQDCQSSPVEKCIFEIVTNEKNPCCLFCAGSINR